MPITVKRIHIATIDAKQWEKKIKEVKVEIDMLSNLSHPNIVQCYGFCMDKDFINIFLEYVGEGSLSDYLHKFGPLNENLVWKFTKQILEGLEYLHS